MGRTCHCSHSAVVWAAIVSAGQDLAYYIDEDLFSKESRSKSLSKNLKFWIDVMRRRPRNKSVKSPASDVLLSASTSFLYVWCGKNVSLVGVGPSNTTLRDQEKRSEWFFKQKKEENRIRFQHYLVHQPLNFISIMMTWVMICWTLNYQFYFSYILCFYFGFFFEKQIWEKSSHTHHA